MTRATHTPHPLGRRIAALFAAAFLAGPAWADAGALLASQPQVLVRSQAQEWLSFGSAIAFTGDIAAIGATGADGPAEDAGAVYLYQRSETGWRENGALRLENVGVEARFGGALEFDGGWLAAGASGVGAGMGAVYLYREEGGSWQQQTRLVPPRTEGYGFTRFGSALSLDAGVLVVGASGYDGEAKDTGLVIIYRLAGDGSWTEEAKLLPEESVAGERFGTDVALDGNRLLVGAAGAAEAGYAEAAYLFEYRNGAWQQVARLSEELGEGSTGYGEAVALQGDTALVGALRAPDDSGESRGLVFAYALRDGTWSRQAVLRSDAPGRGDEFGVALALDNDIALVAAPRDDGAADDAGAVFVFSRDDGHWQMAGRLDRSDAESYDNFGYVLALENGSAWVGTPSQAAPGSDVRGTGTVTRYVP